MKFSDETKFLLGSFALYALVIAAVIIFALLVGACAPTRPRELRVEPPQIRIVASDALVRDALAEVYSSVAKLDVLARDEDGSDLPGVGSGALIESGDLIAWVLTADHVVAPTGGAILVRVEVSFPDGQKHLARVWKHDFLHDLALVEVFGHIARRPISVAKEDPRLLERVWQFGAADGETPLTVGQGMWGGLKYVTRPAPFLARRVVGGFTWPGMSGGPVVDARGRLVGVISSVHCGGDCDGDWVPQMANSVDGDDVRALLDEVGIPFRR